jgi:hypothetical protein
MVAHVHLGLQFKAYCLPEAIPKVHIASHQTKPVIVGDEQEKTPPVGSKCHGWREPRHSPYRWNGNCALSPRIQQVYPGGLDDGLGLALRRLRCV